VELVAEHGAWIRQQDTDWPAARMADWHCAETSSDKWKDAVRPILELFSDRTPGSLVEEKDFSLVWHYRKANQELAHVRRQELRNAVVNLTANLDVGVFEGSKILEIRKLGISKGRAAGMWLEKEHWDFIFAAGDDYTDEEMFAVLPDNAYSIRVGVTISKARFNVDTVHDVRLLLSELAGGKYAQS
jgi:trehalose 6-phosphate synthase/phosphatase